MTLSCLDSTKQITENTWAITMIRVNKIHAQLVIESVENRVYKLQIAHLIGLGNCNVSRIDCRTFKKYG